MIATLKRWARNIKWLLNHPPTLNTYNESATTLVCDYCKSSKYMVTKVTSGDVCYSICVKCTKEALDAVLKNQE